jgi:hypothetical protein
MSMTDTPTYPEVESPFPDTNSLLVDMTKHTGMSGAALRVELRRVREPAAGPLKPENRVAESSFVIGLTTEDKLPQEGQPFTMPYHLMSGNEGYGIGHVIDFGYVDSKESVVNVSVVDDTDYHFETSEGLWRLRLLGKGN